MMSISDLIFYYIEISGFMSYPPKIPQKVILNTRTLTTIIGENLDGGEGERNGVGKSAIIDAIVYLLFGKSPRVSNQGFINYVNPGPMFVIGEASRDGILFRIERGENPAIMRLFEKPIEDSRDWRTKDGNTLLFEKTKSRPETTKRIIELIGFDSKLADVLLANNPSDKSCYFLKTEEDQRNIIERIFGFTVFTEKAELLRDMRREETKNLATKESALQATRLANDRVMVQIKILEEKSEAWAVDKDKLMKFLTQQVRSFQKIDFKTELKGLGEIETLLREIGEINREMGQHRQAISMAEKRVQQWQTQYENEVNENKKVIALLEKTDPTADIEIIHKKDALQISIRELNDQIRSFHQQADANQRQMETDHIARGRLQKEISAIEKQIIQLNESKCPTCGQDWVDTKDHVLHCIADLDTRTEEVQKNDDNLRTLKTNYSTAKSQAEKLERQLGKLQTESNKLTPTTFKTIEEATKSRSLLEGLQERLKEQESLQNPHNENIGELYDLVAQCKKKKAKLETQIEKKPKNHYQTMQEATEAKKNFDTVSRQFDELSQAENPHRSTIDNLRNEVLQKIDDTEIETLRSKIEHMSLLIKLLSDRDSPIRMSILHEWLPELNDRVNRNIEFLELPHRITFDANMTATFYRNSKELSFGNLSTGQRLRVWLATNKAFRDIFELINYNINLFFVDELLDKGMSARGAQVSYDLLNDMVHNQEKSVFLISHRQELCDLSNHQMTIVLENGLSTIIS